MGMDIAIAAVLRGAQRLWRRPSAVWQWALEIAGVICLAGALASWFGWEGAAVIVAIYLMAVAGIPVRNR